jgi:plasmid stabilization system protein ParE
MRVQFITPAAQEFLAAVDFYETQPPGLGNDSILDVEDSPKLIQEFPNLGSTGPAGARRIHLHRFPCSVVYRPEEELLRVIAVEHQRRRPGFWMNRLK